MLFWIEQGVTHLPRRQPAHQAVRLLGVADRARCARSIPEVIFLAEAFTRPKVMYRLAKVGFTQSYTYFTWRNTKAELTEYFTELTQTRVREFLRPNLFANTPDILPEYLQIGGRAGVPDPASSWRRRSAPATASTARPFELLRARARVPGTRGVSATPRSTRSVTGTWIGPAACATSSRA